MTLAVDGGAQAASDDELAGRLAPQLDPEVLVVAQLLLSELVINYVLPGAAGHPRVSRFARRP